MPNQYWDEYFGFRLGPFGFWAYPYRPFHLRYSRTDKSHLLRTRMRAAVEKEETKARWIEPDVLEIEWPRRARGEEIPIE